MIIYKITNSITEKVYIGQTVQNLNDRWIAHKNSNHCRRLYNSIKRHGSENFKIEQIDSAENIEDLNRKECYWISYYDSTNPDKGYNLTSGGTNSLHSEETKLKMSRSRVGKKLSKEHIDKIKKHNMGRKMPDHLKEKLRKINTGRPLSEEHKKKLSEVFSGRPCHIKCQQALAEYNEKRKIDKSLDDYRIKRMSEALKGHIRSEESKNKQKETRKQIELYKISRGWKIPTCKVKKKLIEEAITLLKIISTLKGEKE